MKKIIACIIFIIALSVPVLAETSVWRSTFAVTTLFLRGDMLEDYNDGADPNNWAGWKSVYPVSMLSASYDAANAYAGTGFCSRLAYGVPSGGDAAALYNPLKDDWGPVDISTYQYISIRAKAQGAETGFRVQLVTGSKNALLNVTALTSSWQQFNFPLSSFFPDVNDLKEVTQFNIIFENAWLQSISSPVSGVVYIDDIKFNK